MNFVKRKRMVKQIDLEIDSELEIPGLYGKAIAIISILFSLFQIYANSLANIDEVTRNGVHLGFLLLLTFLIYPGRKKATVQHKPGIWNIIFSILGSVSALYIVLFFTEIHTIRNSQAILQDYIFAIIAIVLTLEAARRAIGIFVPVLCLLFLGYAYFGPYMPGMLGHAGFSLERLLFRMYMTTEGILGITLSISSTYIFLFILFGAFLKKSGAAELFNDLSISIAGKKRGGPAKVAVVSSAMMGTLSGSPVANVATTGAFTIPLMKKVGYKPYYAGAVEAAASTGGIITPPIMGAAAFIMTGFLGVPFSTILIAAIIPATLYYFGILVMTDLESKKMNLTGMDADKIPKVWNVLKKRGILLLPIIAIIWALLSGRTPLFAGFVGIIVTIIASWFNKETRIGIKEFLEALEEGAKGAVQVGVATAACGIIVGVVNMTGIGSVLSYNILDLSGGILFVSLLFVMITSIILGMGMPATALYIVVAVTVAPALIEMGVTPLAAHFFVFFFGALSNLTPPVALASYTAAGLAKADPMKTSWTGLKLTLAGFIIPFVFVYNPIILLQTDESFNIFFLLLTILTAFLGVYILAIAASNYLNRKLVVVERLLFFVSALLLITPGIMSDVIGVGLIIITLIFNRLYKIKVIESSNTA